MRSKRVSSRGKKINPHFWVFCEGETEEAYIRFLRSEYRLPIEIVPKVSGSGIDERFIQAFKKGKPIHEKDKDFLVYDADVPDVLDKLKRIRKAILIASNPAIEIWFLLHYRNQNSAVTVEECIKEINNKCRIVYKKGMIHDSLKIMLKDRMFDACERSRQMVLFENPSTNMHAFIDALESVKNEVQ